MGISSEVDPRHIEIIVEQFGLKHSKFARSPGTKEEGGTQTIHENKLDEGESSKYRATVARCNYIALDRPDVAYAAIEFAKHTANANNGDWHGFTRLGRHQEAKPRLQQMYRWQQEHGRA